jgi:glycosyltransferase involved in cell wall biosynthesis
MKILIELRPALDGHAGIPQESRLLFRGLSLLPQLSVEGLIQTSVRKLAKGLPSANATFQRRLSKDRQINRLSRLVVSVDADPRRSAMQRWAHEFMEVMTGAGLVASDLLGLERQLTHFDPEHFRDFIWRSMFARTLPHEDFDTVTQAQYRVATVPWTTMHIAALLTKKFGFAVYPRINSRDFDVMIAQTPYPGVFSKRTKLVVRYHDAIPLLMPHTIANKAFHQASHYSALKNNIARGGHFACVSEATRKDLVSIFPAVEERATTIHNMVSHHYFAEESTPARIGEILRTRAHVTGSATHASEPRKPAIARDLPRRPIQYLLIVSTIEPRKNHLSLVAAWEQLRVEKFPDLKLVTVGMLGWDHEKITRKFRPWQLRGELVMLEDVPAPELRLLYKHAQATVCPSFGEGFDFCGVEAMRCGGVVAASDIPVHREVYGHAAEYFSPYSVADAAHAISRLIDPANTTLRDEFVARGATQSAQYMPEKILPQWEKFLARLAPTDAKQ